MAYIDHKQLTVWLGSEATNRRTNSPLWLRLSPNLAAGTLVNRINAPNRGEDQQPDLESRTRARAAPLSGLVAELVGVLVGCW